jgi:hypothetical protein
MIILYYIAHCNIILYVCMYSDAFKSGDGSDNSIESVIERLKNLQASSTASSSEREWSTKTLSEVCFL